MESGITDGQQPFGKCYAFQVLALPERAFNLLHAGGDGDAGDAVQAAIVIVNIACRIHESVLVDCGHAVRDDHSPARAAVLGQHAVCDGKVAFGGSSGAEAHCHQRSPHACADEPLFHKQSLHSKNLFS